VSRVVIHGERRAREMEEVAETLRSVGIEPIMAEAAARRQDWCARLGISSKFGAAGPGTYQEALEAIAACTSSYRKGVESTSGSLTGETNVVAGFSPRRRHCCIS